MQCNIGKKDRIIRIIAGLAAIGYGIISNSLIFDLIGAMIIFIALIKWCPAYAIFKISTDHK